MLQKVINYYQCCRRWRT